ncbi:MAG: NAD-dependent deacylase [Chloroflexi bacterium]|nr:NAD-dependent deacylase [Chloroflexota bacterium]
MAFEQEIQQAAETLAASHHAVALTGAGHSTPSGIPDFRSPGSGLWEGVDPMKVASLYGFQRNPQAFYEWIRPLAKQIMEAKPNPAHFALAELEQMGVLQVVITQNIDELHQRAGSKRVLEVHGSVRTATCTRCHKQVSTAEMWPLFVASGTVPHCPACGGLLKPDVVLFGELLPLDVIYEAQQEAEHCDVMLVAGSSLEVYPAAELPNRAVEHGARLIVVNYAPTYMDGHATVVIHEDVAVILPQIAAKVRQLRERQ